MVLVVKKPPANEGKARDMGSILGQEIPWRRKWPPTPVSLPRKSQAQRSLVDYSPGSQCPTRLPESDTTKHTRRVYRRPPEVPDLPVGSLWPQMVLEASKNTYN